MKSTDGGVTFGDSIKLADDFDINYPTGVTTRPDCIARGQARFRRVLSNSCFRVNAYGGPAVAPDGTLYLVWSDNRNSNNVHSDTDVFLARSRDGGDTWSDTIRVNQDPVGSGRDQFFPGRRWLRMGRCTSSSMTAVSRPRRPSRLSGSRSARPVTTLGWERATDGARASALAPISWPGYRGLRGC